jgi:hypothetical protein
MVPANAGKPDIFWFLKVVVSSGEAGEMRLAGTQKSCTGLCGFGFGCDLRERNPATAVPMAVRPSPGFERHRSALVRPRCPRLSAEYLREGKA